MPVPDAATLQATFSVLPVLDLARVRTNRRMRLREREPEFLIADGLLEQVR